MKDFEENRLLGCRNTRGILHYKNREAAEVAMSLGMSFFTTAVGRDPTEHLFMCHWWVSVEVCEASLYKSMWRSPPWISSMWSYP